jgi:hypothetical protein
MGLCYASTKLVDIKVCSWIRLFRFGLELTNLLPSRSIFFFLVYVSLNLLLSSFLVLALIVAMYYPLTYLRGSPLSTIPDPVLLCLTMPVLFFVPGNG